MKSNFITKEVLDSLSHLESEIINALVPGKNYRAKDIYAIVKSKASKSSISVILDRLYQKGLVNRTIENAKGGIRFIYRLEQNKVQFEKSVVDKVVNAVIKKFGSNAVVYFNESLKKRSTK